MVRHGSYKAESKYKHDKFMLRYVLIGLAKDKALGTHEIA